MSGQSQAVVGEVQQLFGHTAWALQSSGAALDQLGSCLLEASPGDWLDHFSPKEFNNLDCFSILFPITAPGGSSLGMRLWLMCLQWFVTDTSYFSTLFVSTLKEKKLILSKHTALWVDVVSDPFLAQLWTGLQCLQLFYHLALYWESWAVRLKSSV